MSIINTLTEGIVNRNMKKEGQALLSKWGKTGLLEGLQSEHEKAGMARLLENQAKELLREANSMSGNDVEGFAAVAFPIVRRVFAGLIANQLVSVQPMISQVDLSSSLTLSMDLLLDLPQLKMLLVFWKLFNSVNLWYRQSWITSYWWCKSSWT